MTLEEDLGEGYINGYLKTACLPGLILEKLKIIEDSITSQIDRGNTKKYFEDSNRNSLAYSIGSGIGCVFGAVVILPFSPISISFELFDQYADSKNWRKPQTQYP